MFVYQDLVLLQIRKPMSLKDNSHLYTGGCCIGAQVVQHQIVIEIYDTFTCTSIYVYKYILYISFKLFHALCSAIQNNTA